MFDYGISFLVVSVIFLGWIVLLGYAIRNRIKIFDWLKSSDTCVTQIPDRKTVIQRRMIKSQWAIDDCRSELEAMETQEKKNTEKEKKGEEDVKAEIIA